MEGRGRGDAHGRHPHQRRSAGGQKVASSNPAAPNVAARAMCVARRHFRAPAAPRRTDLTDQPAEVYEGGGPPGRPRTLARNHTADAGRSPLRGKDEDRYPFIAILEGEVAMLDGAGNEDDAGQGRSEFPGRTQSCCRGGARTSLPGSPSFLGDAGVRGRRAAPRSLLFDDEPLERSAARDVYRPTGESLQRSLGAGTRDRRPAFVRQRGPRAACSGLPATVHLPLDSQGIPRFEK